MAGPRHRRDARSGILAIDKPAGMTSFDAVRGGAAHLRRAPRRPRRHARPHRHGAAARSASGQATRLVDYFHQQSKTYRCVVRFGEVSDTLDTEGVVSRRRRLRP